MHSIIHNLRRLSAVFLGFSLLTLCVSLSTAQEYRFSADAEARFSSAMGLFRARSFREACVQFDTLSCERPVHQRTTASALMFGKSCFELEEYSRADSAARSLLAHFSASSYRPDAEYLIGLASLMLQKYAVAMEYFTACYAEASDPQLRRQARVMSESVGQKRLGTPEFERLIRTPHQGAQREFLLLLLADRFAKDGDVLRATSTLDQLHSADTTGEIARGARELRRRLSATAKLRVGVLLPRSDPALKSVGDQMLDGVRFALETYRERHHDAPAVEFELEDTDVDSMHLLDPMKRLLANREVVGIVGPLFSAMTLSYAPLANENRIALVSPTATADGLAATGRYVFQSNPDFRTRGKAMARYAVKVLGYANVAILSSSDEKAQAMAKAFGEEAARLGATVVANETYGRDTTDLRDQFMNIRKTSVGGGPRISFAGKITLSEIRAMLKAGANRSVLEHARRRGEAVELSELFGSRAQKVADSLKLRVIQPDAQFGSLEIPVTNIDGLFLSVGSSDEISVVAPQVSYFNIRTQILGSPDWNDIQVLESNKRYVNGALFVGDSYVDAEDSAASGFTRAFTSSTGSAPTVYSLYGYDTMSLLLEQIAAGAVTREQLAVALGSVESFEGIHAPIGFVHGRVNTHLHILKYSNGGIIRIAEISVD